MQFSTGTDDWSVLSCVHLSYQICRTLSAMLSRATRTMTDGSARGRCWSSRCTYAPSADNSFMVNGCKTRRELSEFPYNKSPTWFLPVLQSRFDHGWEPLRDFSAILWPPARDLDPTSGEHFTRDYVSNCDTTRARVHLISRRGTLILQILQLFAASMFFHRCI